MGTRVYEQGAGDTELAITYDDFRRVSIFDNKVSGGSSFAGYAYAYDKSNNRVYERDYTSGDGDLYAYDEQNQITGAKYGVSNASFSGFDPDDYDFGEDFDHFDRSSAFGINTTNGRTSVDDDLGGASTHDASYTLDALNQHTQRIYGSTTYLPSYDYAGNLNDTDTSVYNYDDRYYNWDHNDKLAKITENSSVGDDIIAYVYDAKGRRVLKDDGTNETRYLYTGWQCIEEHVDDGGGFEFVAEYVYGLGIDELLQMRRDLNDDQDFEDDYEVVFYHTNVQGNVVAITDSSGNVIEEFTYDIYGRLTSAEAWDGDSKETVLDGDTDGDGDVDGNDDSAFDNDFIDAIEYRALSVIGNPYLFQSRRLDEESGLYYFRHRQYDPQHGTFISRDPAGYKDSYNLYQFVNNNPMRYTDALGLGIPGQGAGPFMGPEYTCGEAHCKARVVLSPGTLATYNLVYYDCDSGYNDCLEVYRMMNQPIEFPPKFAPSGSSMSASPYPKIWHKWEADSYLGYAGCMAKELGAYAAQEILTNEDCWSCLLSIGYTVAKQGMGTVDEMGCSRCGAAVGAQLLNEVEGAHNCCDVHLSNHCEEHVIDYGTVSCRNLGCSDTPGHPEMRTCHFYCPGAVKKNQTRNFGPLDKKQYENPASIDNVLVETTKTVASMHCRSCRE